MSPKKALVLGTMLLVPVLAFLFLKTFGVNRFSLPTYFPTSVDSTLVSGKWQYDTVYHKVPDYQLTSQTGAIFSQKDLHGKIYVANFFSTTCQEPCKKVNAQLQRVQDAFRLQPDVKILSFSSTPSQDSPAKLQQYAEVAKANIAKWTFLTGSEAQIMNVAQDGLRLTSPESAVDGTSSAVQSQRLFLVDRQRHIRGIYNGADPGEVDRLITEINVLLSENNLNNGK